MTSSALGLAALALCLAFCGAAAQGEGRQVPGFTYLFATDLQKVQPGDVIQSIDTLFWDGGESSDGMHKCARVCRKEGGGGVCAAFTFCADARRCHLLSRLPSSLEAARPPALARPGGMIQSALGYNAYNPKCTSGFSQAAASRAELASECKASVHPNTALGDTMSLTNTLRSRVLRLAYEANQPSPAACCELCASLRSRGCSAWSYDPNGWMLDRSLKCTLRAGTNPAMSTSRGVTSGVMNDK
ncbi:hypothetical protein Rsub_00688 [Raphidocelis subcapitata]|uniref:Apple domain-containing protein n=1 Tax=Raphidocelis subcapitata TaxID=307507 RepID=A0A2V0NKU4_9CHLO|nr:hypothetical protein Rsub_00688 [Raphidocelis subcapitata]|eukprot:GBF87976.1 hypothetical protein Rsub_00688 [Raphidocelis subcapitata]